MTDGGQGLRRDRAALARAAEALFHGALERSDDGVRRRWLSHATGGDSELLAEVEDLLAAHAQSNGFLERGPLLGVQDRGLLDEDDDDGAAIDASVGERLGPYLLVELIGEGGFGSVYRAEQQEPVRRDVALKIIKLGMDTRRVIARFEAERQALALMDHPSIARVLDAGTTAAGRPYFVMDLVQGIDLTSFCDAERLSIRERCEVFLELCSAVQHAHQRGLIHRDLKPSNVLAARRDGVIQVKVIDFGIAKATTNDAAGDVSGLRTEQGQVIGTPVYMSPEQAIGRADIDTRSDVYALGVILYELLAGSTPLSAEQLRDRALAGETAVFLGSYEPQLPSARLMASGDASAIALRRGGSPQAVRARVRGDLDFIALRALESDRNRRYESAAALKRDVRRALENRPIEASPPSSIYRSTKFVRRHRIVASAGAVVLAALVSGGLIAARSLAAQENQAEEHLDLLKAALDPAALGGDDARAATREYERRISRAFGDGASAFLVGGLATLADRLERSSALDEAVVARQRALHHALESDDPVQIVSCRTALGLQLIRLGEVQRGEQQLIDAVELDDRTTGGSPRTHAARLELSHLALQVDDHGRAEAYASAANEIARTQAPRNLRMQSDALRQLIDVRTRRRDGDGAVAAWRSLFDLLAQGYGEGELARERVRCGRWLASVGRSREAAFYLRLGLDALRAAKTRNLELELEALTIFNRLATEARDMFPPETRDRELQAEYDLARAVFAPMSADYADALRRVAQHYEMREQPLDELAVLLELRRAFVEGRAGGASGAERAHAGQVQVLGALIEARTLAAVDAVCKGGDPIDGPIEAILREGIEVARAFDPTSDALVFAQIELEVRTGNVIRIFKLLDRLPTERDNPFVLAWRAAACAQVGTPAKLDDAEDYLAEARAALKGTRTFDEPLQWTIAFVERMVADARAKGAQD